MLAIGSDLVLDRAGFASLLDALRSAGYRLVGPTLGDGAIVLDTITGIGDLPRGVGDEQAPGRYRLRERGDEALFGYAVPAQPLKRELLPPRVPLVQLRKSAREFVDLTAAEPAPKIAFIGARACELAAISVQDKVLFASSGRGSPDADYQKRRSANFILAVHCGSPAGTCFCVSMQTGPRARGSFDLAATELLDGGHRFVVEIGSELGRAMLQGVASRAATDADRAAAQAVTDHAAANMGRTLSTDNLRDDLMANLDHPRWQVAADRCLGCANCTMSCPTCFCTTIEDTTDLSGDVATRTRRWDSCFSADFAYVHGGSARPSLRARYRQFVTHKLATWHDQFDSSGCVGCGRCITWCPVGIDITEEAAAVRAPVPSSRSKA
ncbi:MAG: 4Fe-4S dicluster domain-containing protein [Polyangiaceae bacterium]